MADCQTCGGQIHDPTDPASMPDGWVTVTVKTSGAWIGRISRNSYPNVNPGNLVAIEKRDLPYALQADKVVVGPETLEFFE